MSTHNQSEVSGSKFSQIFKQKALPEIFEVCSSFKQLWYITNLIQDAKLFKNKNLVGEPEFTSGEKTQLWLFGALIFS